MKFYVASSWKNQFQPQIVEIVRLLGHEVYDFRNPINHFKWEYIDPTYKLWTPQKYVENINHELAIIGFNADFEAMKWADAFILLLPSGRSAHLEAGWAVGANKPLCILVDETFEPELMYKMADLIATTIEELIEWVSDLV